ncbi:hypothetical protein [Clostridium sp. YIM B02569]|uniref:hypothetical protein n=1 Tax=Clostridium sp. YIM B02569 TaxID=2911967 RepID=UPI001EEBA206|nr:hypothetical protein [Clostridium sp. YIM B02569]
MEYKYEYKTEEERLNILAECSELILIEEQNITEGNFLLFIDLQTQQKKQETQELSNRISDISEYVASSDKATITEIENSILEIEKNKIINGGM